MRIFRMDGKLLGEVASWRPTDLVNHPGAVEIPSPNTRVQEASHPELQPANPDQKSS